ncbi:MAG: hypothetical protein GX076_08675 [Clostridiales bacterium]|nr:hypothetical protein [Clostridiales bacterium]
MKRKLALFLVITMTMLAFVACGGGGDAEPPGDGDQEPTDGAVKTGLAVITSADNSSDAGDGEGVAEAYSNVVAVIVDGDGRILNCSIDAAQTKINFTADGKITTPLDSVFVSKQELGDEYGMKKASNIGKEWNEQANAFADYVIGKTVDEIKGISLNQGVPADEDLASSVTIHVTDFISAIEKAVKNAVVLGANADDKLGIGIVTTIDKSQDAGDEEGIAQAYTNYAAVTFDASGVITSCIIDASQTNIKFDSSGKITDSKGPYLTKNEIGDDYGMREASSIGREWYEQAASFADYVVGKTVNEVKGISLSDGVPADEDLASSVTIGVGQFINVIEKASIFSR